MRHSINIGTSRLRSQVLSFLFSYLFIDSILFRLMEQLQLYYSFFFRFVCGNDNGVIQNHDIQPSL